MSRELRERAGKELAELERVNGKLLRREVVEKAKDVTSALHEYFTWDTEEAAERYWLETAGALIRAYKVWVTVQGSTEPTRVRAFVSLSSDRAHGGGYRSLARILEDEELHETMLADALKELRVFQRKYEALSELQSVFEEIEKIIRKRPKAAQSDARATA